MIDLRKHITRRFDIDMDYLDVLQTVYQACPEAMSFLDNVTAEEEDFIKQDFCQMLGARLFCNGDLYDLWEKEILDVQQHEFLCCMDPLIFGIFKALFGDDWDFDLYSGTSSEILGIAFGPGGFEYGWKNTAMESLKDWFIEEFDADPDDPYPTIIDNFGPPDECESVGSYALFWFGIDCDPVLVDDCMQMLGASERGSEGIYGMMILGDYEMNYEMELYDIPQRVLDAVKALPKKKDISKKARRAMECFSYNEYAHTNISDLIDKLLHTYRSEMQVIL